MAVQALAAKVSFLARLRTDGPGHQPSVSSAPGTAWRDASERAPSAPMIVRARRAGLAIAALMLFALARPVIENTFAYQGLEPKPPARKLVPHHAA